MISFGEVEIEKMVKTSDEAMTYGEVLAKCLNIHPYFPSLVTNVCLSCNDISKLDLFFDNPHEKAINISNIYASYFLPAVKNLESKGAIENVNTNDKKYATHTNFVFDDNQKLFKRLEKESERKRYIQPALTSTARGIARRISEECPQEFRAYLVGSGSPKSVKPFIYYKNRDVLEAVSDLDITIFAKILDIKSLQLFFDEISRKRKIPLNIVRRYEIQQKDRGMIEKGMLLN